MEPEDSPLARVNFQKQMEILDFLWEKMKKEGKDMPNISLHAGELVLKGSPVEPMRNRISLSIEKGHALRIGHGNSIPWEDDVVGLLNKMRDEGILVEVCLTTDESIIGVKDNDHPFQLYRRAGVPVSLNTDDEGISRSNLTVEFVKAIQRYDLAYEEVKEIIRSSLEYSFLPGKSLFEEHNYQCIRKEFAGVRKRDWKADGKGKELMKDNQKLKQQVILEREFVKFEQLLENGFTGK